MRNKKAIQVLLALAVVLLAGNLARNLVAPALAADRDEGPVGTYQISTYSLPPTDTRPNWVLGYFIVDTRTGDVEREEDTVW